MRDDDLFRTVTGCNLGIGRAIFELLGGFDESFTRWGGEDTEFGWRAWTREARWFLEWLAAALRRRLAGGCL